MTFREAMQELVQPEQCKRHFQVFTHAVGVMVLDIVVFLLTLLIGTVLFQIRWGTIQLVIGLIGGVLLWVWMTTGGKV